MTTRSTNLRRACSAALLLAGAVALASCRSGTGVAASGAPVVTGEEAFRSRTCWRCHALDRSGTEIGPPLHGLSRDWNVESLSRYIDDPAPFRERDARIQALVSHYRGRLMKGFAMGEEERRALAEWLLQDAQ